MVNFIEEKGDIIGSDESLKGDTFGGIVVAAVKADDQTRKKLIQLGVQDSKQLTDHACLKLAKQIEKIAGFCVQNIFPQEYNNFKENQTVLLDKLHKKCYTDLKPGTHIVDKYPGCKVGDIIVIKADAKYVEVAAASIIARATALQQLKELSHRAKFTVPKGSTHVQHALEKIKQFNLPPKQFVKLNFKNVRNFLSRS
jgi:ribonuclease HIII